MQKYVFKKSYKKTIIFIIDILGYFIFFPFRFFRKRPPSFRKILVVRADQAGDVVQALPFFERLVKKYPEAEIHALVSAETAFLLKGGPGIKKIIKIDKGWFSGGRLLSLRTLFAAVKNIRKEKYDAAFELRGDIRNIAALFMGGVKYIKGYGCTGGGFMLDNAVSYDKNEHEIDKNLRLLGVESFPGKIEMNFPGGPAAEEAAGKIISGHEKNKKIFIHPFAGYASRMWGEENYVRLINMIRGKNPETVFFISGGPAEKGLMKKIFEIPGTVDLVGLGWEETIAVIKRCGLFIGSDSVMQYFSAYSGVNTAVIAGYIVEYGRWKPKVDSGKLEIFRIPVHCGPCESNVCVNEKEGHICMTGITPEMVYERIKKWV